MAVSLKSSPDFNRPVTLQVGSEPPNPSPHKSVMEMEQFFKRYYGETPQAPHSNKFKPDPKAWYQHTLVVKVPDNESKKKVRKALQR
eukprot:g12655.t1